ICLLRGRSLLLLVFLLLLPLLIEGISWRFFSHTSCVLFIIRLYFQVLLVVRLHFQLLEYLFALFQPLLECTRSYNSRPYLFPILAEILQSLFYLIFLVSHFDFSERTANAVVSYQFIYRIKCCRFIRSFVF
ncbi:hypothetical protein PMAYCL1PPCAC_31564, partial [Pristionchus mayeri]